MSRTHHYKRLPRPTWLGWLVVILGMAAFGGVSAAIARAADTTLVRALIVDRAAAHGVDPDWMLRVAACESRFEPTARGSRGERGVYQWMQAPANAWDFTLAAEQGVPNPGELYDRGDPDALYFDVDGAAEMFARGRAVVRHHWSCAR